MRLLRWLTMLLCGAMPLRAETHLVAIGVEKYEDPAISPLTYADQDAESFARAMIEGGTETRNISLLTSASTDAANRSTRSAILKALQRVRTVASAEATIIVFFSGHGVQTERGAFLLPVDANRELLADTALPMSLVQTALNGVQAAQVVFIIDACRNNPESGKAVEDASLDERFAKGLRPRLSRPAAEPLEPVLLLACEIGERAWEMPEAGHGAFTHFLLEGLRGGGSAPDGAVRLNALASYLDRAVPEWCARAQKPLQRPRLDPPDSDLALLPKALPKPVQATGSAPAGSAAGRLPAAHTVIVDAAGGADYTTIQAAIGAAQESTRILVKPGFYREDIGIHRPVELIGDGPADEILIQSVVGHCLWVTTDATIAGLTLLPRAPGKDGGVYSGIQVTAGKPLIEDLRINDSSGFGVSVGGVGAAPLVRNCLIARSTQPAINVYDGAAGRFEDVRCESGKHDGVWLHAGARPSLIRVRCCQNLLLGFRIEDNAVANLEDCEATGNQSAGLWALRGAKVTVVRLVAQKNSGSGVVFQEGARGSLSDCVLTGNGGPSCSIADDCQVTKSNVTE